ncbi:cobyrinate a,c-diamide synthase [Desulfovibrio sp. SGI.169]|uniref:cobyrinate a,c-diamide synthase n=1 Tax=Desulfovibrio sp. SGI.169 TaxID=3420561 RepID=UPI003D056136
MAQKTPHRIPGLVVAGTGSNTGKTVTTLALLCALRARGLRVHAAKSGPDFIDAAFHAALTGAPAANLDVWMCREARACGGEAPLRRMPGGLARIFARMRRPDADGRPADMLLVEGAMGLYDGGAGGAGCTAQLAALLGLPVLLTLNTHGLGQSVAALAEGFLRHRPAWAVHAGQPAFAGMICTHVGGKKHGEILRQALAPLTAETGVPLLGLLPREGAPQLKSRHLGLVEARESLPGLNREALSAWLEAHCQVTALLRALNAPLGVVPAQAAPASVTDAPPARFFTPRVRRLKAARRPRLGVAWDAAFSFCYADLPALLRELGAELHFFSPLRDAAPPACDGLYFPGGYPELHAQALAANTGMRATLRALAKQGLPIYGECGGYIYLMRALRLNGRHYPMSGLLPLTCLMDGQRAALGYRAARALPGWPAVCAPGLSGSARPLRARGHEFHYGRLEEATLPNGCAPLWQLSDSQGAILGPEGCRLGAAAGSWLHLYPEGARRFWRAWLAGL